MVTIILLLITIIISTSFIIVNALLIIFTLTFLTHVSYIIILFCKDSFCLLIPNLSSMTIINAICVETVKLKFVQLFLTFYYKRFDHVWTALPTRLILHIFC